jgi:glycosyltransferase involved in cell wall biosynthesis
MARILLSAYACEPGRGSEPGVGWSWATELARLGHAVTVLTRSANRQAIEREAGTLPTHLRFLYYDLPKWAHPVRRLPGGKPAYYVLWQWFAARRIRRRFTRSAFDFVQHVTYVSARYPSFMGSLGIPFCFGPVSGGETVPPALRSGFSRAERCRERLRDLSNRLVALDPVMRRTFAQAQRIVVTRDTIALLPRIHRHKASAKLAIGLPSAASIRRSRTRPHDSELRLLFVGRLLHWKGVDIALQAVAEAHRRDARMKFIVVGDGPARPRLERLARELQLQDVVQWRGWVPQSKLADHYCPADVLLFPSLRDSGGMVVLEALACGLPVVCTDLGGPGLIVNDSCGRVIATHQRTSQQLARCFSEALIEIAANPVLLESLSRGATQRANAFRFEDLVRSVYASASRELEAEPA